MEVVEAEVAAEVAAAAAAVVAADQEVGAPVVQAAARVLGEAPEPAVAIVTVIRIEAHLVQVLQAPAARAPAAQAPAEADHPPVPTPAVLHPVAPVLSPGLATADSTPVVQPYPIDPAVAVQEVFSPSF